MKTKNFLFIILSIAIGQLITISPAFADGFIIVPPVPGHPISNPFPLEVKYHHVDVEIDDQVAVTKIDQVFYNPSRRRLEGTYIFPVPKNVVIQEFSMDINGKEMEAELLDAKKARKIYEDIVRKALDPALLEYQDQALFKMRIFPIEPRSEKRIKINYSEVLDKDDHACRYLYPLNTEKFSAKPLNDVSINVHLSTSTALKNIYCPTHEVEIVKKHTKKATVSFEERNTKPNRDFELFFSTAPAPLGATMQFFRQQGEEGFFILNISPGFVADADQSMPKDITFVLDVSGSMAGEKLDQAKASLLFCLNNLNKNDRFQLIRFSTEARALFSGLSKANRSHVNEAKAFVHDLKAIGGTNIHEALTLALQAKPDEDRPHIVVFITDGKPTIGVTQEAELIQKIQQFTLNKTRIFTFGVGYDINTHLLDKITEMTQAYRSYITPEEDIEIKISDFYTKVQHPVLTDMTINYGRKMDVYKMQPKALPDLFKNGSIIVTGRYRGQGRSKIRLSGTVNGVKKQFVYDFQFPQKAEVYDYLPALWAARYIGYLLDQIRLHGEDSELIEEVTSLARTYGIITPYTSYLILEDETVQVSRRQLPVEHRLLSEMEASAPAAQVKEDFDSMRSKSGFASTRSSAEVQKLNHAQNVVQILQGKDRLNYRDAKNELRNITQQVQNVQGRAFYQSGKYWNDSRLQSRKWKSTQRIQFASRAYFDLLNQKSKANFFMALGKHVRFVLDEVLYEVYE